MSDSKARYADFCENGFVPLHLQPWWLDAVCGPNAWNVALSMDKSGAVIGAFPYHLTRRWGLKTLLLPPLTTYGGPWIHFPQHSDYKSVSRLSLEHKVMTDLISQLPRVFFFKLNFRPERQNWLPFYWKGFQQTTRYTYIFEEIRDLKKITTGFKPSLRNHLKNAEISCESRRDDAAWASLFDLNKASFKRKKRQQPFAFEAFQRLHLALQKRDQSACFIAYDKASGQASAGLYLVFDERQAGILLTGTEPALKNQSAVYLLFLEAIKFCAERSLSLDFEGSMDKDIEHSFRAFGAQLVPYFQVWKFGIH